MKGDRDSKSATSGMKSTWQCITLAHKIMMHVLMTYKEHEEHTCTCMALLYNVTRSKSHTPRNVPAPTPLHSERRASTVSNQRTPEKPSDQVADGFAHAQTFAHVTSPTTPMS